MQGDDPNSNSEGSRIMSKKLKHENKGILLICNIRMMIKNIMLLLLQTLSKIFILFCYWTRCQNAFKRAI